WETILENPEIVVHGDAGWARKMAIRRQLVSEATLGKGATYPTDDFRLPVLLGEFTDVSGIKTKTDFQNLLFDNNATGTMTEYYDEVSYGQFSVTGTVYDDGGNWFTVSNNQVYYASDNNGMNANYPQNGHGFVREVVVLADPTVDFSQFDNDGPDGIPNSGDDDGYVDGVMVVFPDGGASAGNSSNLWSFMSNLSSPYTTNDAKNGGGFIIVSAFCIGSELAGSGGGTTIRPIGVFAHEFGHILGLADLYDRTSASEGIGNWGMMAGGSWGGNGSSPEKPSHLCAWSKIQMGWLSPTVLTSDITGQTINQVETNAEVLKISEDGYNSRRYFLVENRQKTGFDVNLPNSGLIVYHVDENQRWGNLRFGWGTNNDDETRKLVDIEAADGQTHMDAKTNRGDAGDTFPGSTNNTSFTNTSTPNSKDYDGLSTGIEITNISASSSAMTADIKVRKVFGYDIVYDEEGITYSGYGLSSAGDYWGGVLFNTVEAGTLKVLDVGLREDNTNIELKVYDALFGGTTPGNLLATETGTSLSSGWHTISIDTNLYIEENTPFFVSIKVENKTYGIPYDYAGDKDQRSYNSPDGNTFANTISALGDINMRAFIKEQDEDTTAPAKPVIIAAAQAGANIAVSWTANSEIDVNKYFIYRNTGSGVTASDKIAEVESANIFYTDTDVIGGRTYYYKISAVDLTGNVSELSDEVSAMIPLEISLESIGDQTVKEGRILRLNLSHTYNGTASVTYSHDSDAPPGELITFDSATGRFEWKTDLESAGEYTFTFNVTDGSVEAFESITITVENLDVFAGETFDPDTTLVNKDIGGTISVQIGGLYTKHQVVIPIDALTENKTIIIRPPQTGEIPSDELSNVPSAVNFIVQGNESGFEFQDSVEITIEFQDFEISNNSSNMRIHIWDPVNNVWKRVRGNHTISLINNTIKVKVKHFSIYGAMEIAASEDDYNLEYGWNMVSIPINIETGNDPVTLFSDDIYPFRNVINNSNIYSYDESTEDWVIPSTIDNGYGYILYAFSDAVADIEGFEETADITHTLSYTNSNGWHLLGNPYAVDINWDTDFAMDPGIDNVYYRWTGSEYEFYPGGGLTSTISSWHGFWVHTTADAENLTISYPGLSKKGITKPVAPEWRMRIIAQSGDVKDSHNYLGVSDLAKMGCDEYDIFELSPLNNEFISLYFPNNSISLTQDIRPVEDEIFWDFEVATNSSESIVSLDWNIPEDIDPDIDIFLKDESTDNLTDMRAENIYSFVKPVIGKSRNAVPNSIEDPSDLLRKVSVDDVTTRKFTIIMTRDSESFVPDSYFLNQNYPNPFNPITKIEYGIPKSGQTKLVIFNSLGQQIRTLVNTEIQAGYHSVMWDGRDDYGIEVSTGVYFYRIVSGEFTNTMKLLLIR
ncbi:M6 family metalloprotease domain-containing protein, partial [candidate division KSB1 bacterium]